VDSSQPPRARFAAIGPPMIPRPQKATFSSGSLAISATSGGLDSQPVSGTEGARRLRRQLFPVQQVPAGGSGLAPLGAGRRVAAALGDEREAHLLERLQLAHDAVSAPVRAGAARPVPERVLDGAQ